MFQKATKKGTKARIALVGSAGGGKTFTALTVASRFVDAFGGKIALIDTERGSASKYADLFQFDTVNITDCQPGNFTAAIKAAAEAGYTVLIIDSLSHAWMGTGGILDQKDKFARTKHRGNDFPAWRDATPLHNALVDAILDSPTHVIVTMRAKTEYVVESYDDSQGRKKTKVVKLGLAPVQRAGLDYEFDIVCDMADAVLTVSKTRCHPLTGKIIEKPTGEFSNLVIQWLSDADDEPAPVMPPPPFTPETWALLVAEAYNVDPELFPDEAACKSALKQMGQSGWAVERAAELWQEILNFQTQQLELAKQHFWEI